MRYSIIEAANDGPGYADEAFYRGTARRRMRAIVVAARDNRRLLIGMTCVAVLGGLLIALLVPREYAAESTVLQPEGGGASSTLAGLVGASGGNLGRLISGAGRTDYTRYLAVLNSRTLREEVISEFGLVETYGLENRRNPQEAALKRLDRNIDLEISSELNTLRVKVYDKDPERAAHMANFIVASLNRRNAALSSENARQTRTFVEQRLREAEAALDSVRAESQLFQERHGIVELTGQANAFMSALAELRGRIAQLEITHQSLQQQYGSENPQVAAAGEALRAARRQMSALTGGGDVVLPASLQNMPALMRQYAALLQAQLIQKQIIETVYPLYEQVRFQERSTTEAVQVLDHAVVSPTPDRPSRLLILMAVSLSGFLLACALVAFRSFYSEPAPYGISGEHSLHQHTEISTS